MSILTEIRKLHFHIVTIFTFIVLLFSVTIYSTLYVLQKKTSQQLATQMIDQVGRGITNTIAGITNNQEVFTKVLRAAVTQSSDITLQNKPLTTMLIDALKFNPTFGKVAIGAEDGHFLTVYEVNRLQIEYFHFTPAKLLPQGVTFAIQSIQKEEKEKWFYYNSNLELLAKESNNEITEDLRLAPWYAKVASWPHFIWLTNPKGFTASCPIWNSEGNSIGVFSTEIPFNQLYNLITHEKIGTHGRALLLDPDGHILVPPTFSSSLATAIFEHYQKTQQEQFIFNNQVVQIVPFYLDIHTYWYLAITVPFDDFFGNFVRDEKIAIVVSFGILLFCIFLIYKASGFISRPIMKLVEQVNSISQFNFTTPHSFKSRITEIEILAYSVELMRSALRSFEKYVPKKIVQTLLEQRKDVQLGGEIKEMTIFFSDIQNFTSIVETLSLDQLTEYLTEYFNIYSTIILEAGGTIDKYVGDGIVAFWNAPQEVREHAEHAVLAALQCIKTTKASSNPFLQTKTRIGIHTSSVVVGNFGSKERFNYTVLGDGVNIASRLEAMNKIYQTTLLVSETVFERLHSQFIGRPIDFVLIKGRQKRMTIYEILGVKQDVPQLEVELCQNFTKAYECFHEGKMQEAKLLLDQLIEKFPNDEPTKILLARCKL